MTWAGIKDLPSLPRPPLRSGRRVCRHSLYSERYPRPWLGHPPGSACLGLDCPAHRTKSFLLQRAHPWRGGVTSIVMDFQGPQYGVTQGEYDAVVKAFPNDDLKSGFNDTMIWLCHSKPATTYGMIPAITVKDHTYANSEGRHLAASIRRCICGELLCGGQ